MIARLSTRHAHGRAGCACCGRCRQAGCAQAQAAAAQQPSPAALLLAKQIVEIKGVKEMFDPLVRGVVEKAKNMFMQTNFMWAKDLNEVAANVHKEYARASSELVDADRAHLCQPFHRGGIEEILAFYQSPLGQK